MTEKANKLIPTEAEEQKALCEWLRKHNIRHFSTSMGVWFGKINYRYIMSLKSRGFEVGVPDLVLLFDNGERHLLNSKEGIGMREGKTVPDRVDRVVTGTRIPCQNLLRSG